MTLTREGITVKDVVNHFRAWADEAQDQHAIHRIMGHRIPGMSGVYAEEIDSPASVVATPGSPAQA